ncbi:MAG: insulinase family protein [Bacteroidaceae bacterium]|nr:insulinase family protein [Bacteroidaceae bacterium]
MSLRTTPPTIQATSFALRRPEEHFLPGGTPLYIIEAPGTGALRLDVVFPVGKQHEIHPLQSYYASQMLRYGCQGYTAAEFAERIDYYGAGLRSSVFMNRTCISLVTLKKHFASTVELMRRMLATPAYDEERLRIRCDADKAQLRVNLQKGSFVAMRTLRQSIYGNQHPCGTLVTPDDYDTLTSQHLRDYYDRYLSKGPCRLYLSGDVDDDTLAVLQSQLSMVNGQQSTDNGQQSTVNGRQSTDNGQLSIVNYDTSYQDSLQKATSCYSSEKLKFHPSQPTLLSRRRHSSSRLDSALAALRNCQLITLPGAVQDSIRIGCPMMDIGHLDYAPMRVLATVLGGYFGSRLMQNVREEKGYTYDIGTHFVTAIPQTLFCIYCEAQAGKAREVIDEVCKEMHRLQTELIPDDELRMVRNYMAGDLCRNYETAFDLIDAYLFEERLALPATHFDEVFDAVQTVSPQRLRQLAQQYLRPEMMHAVVVSNEENEKYCVKNRENCCMIAK